MIYLKIVNPRRANVYDKIARLLASKVPVIIAGKELSISEESLPGRGYKMLSNVELLIELNKGAQVFRRVRGRWYRMKELE